MTKKKHEAQREGRYAQVFQRDGNHIGRSSGDDSAAMDGGGWIGEGVIMIEYHPSFEPVSKLFDVWSGWNPTPDDIARKHLADVRAQIKQTDFTQEHKKIIGQSWGVLPRGARRMVLSSAGLSAEDWERPIDSFSCTEREALRAAALAAVRVFERVANAI